MQTDHPHQDAAWHSARGTAARLSRRSLLTGAMAAAAAGAVAADRPARPPAPSAAPPSPAAAGGVPVSLVHSPGYRQG